MTPGTPQSTRRQLRQKVAERIRQDILEGRLAPGEWLRQERLAQDQEVSQMPVREALKQLAAEGLVEHVPYHGVRVVQFTREDVEDLYACRAFIEGMAARHAAVNISTSDLEELVGLQERMRACSGPESLPVYREANRRFHAIIFNASRRSFLVRTLAQLWSAFPTMLWASFGRTAAASAPGREEADNAEHDAIVAAFVTHDGDAAEIAMRRHIGTSGSHLLAAVTGEARAPANGETGTAGG
jgi:DNA-binding GntR family transcriptional regulator